MFTADVKTSLSIEAQNFLRTLIANRRLALLPEIAAQYHGLKNTQEGIADAEIVSAFPMADAQVAELVVALE